MPNQNSNGADHAAKSVPLATYAVNERQHCPACNTDGAHRLQEETVKPNTVVLYRCETCGDRHERQLPAKTSPTIDSNRATLAGRVVQTPLANEVVTLVREREGLARADQPIDEVEKPAHYNTSKIEPIDVIEAWGLGFCDGNALKYICRAPHKGTQLKDLRKARWYLNRLIKQLEGAQVQAQQAVPQ